MKILILLCYYNRPKMVQLALNSVKTQSYQNWELAIVDDSPQNPIVLDDELSNDDRVKIYNTNDTDEQKYNQGGSRFAEYWNQAINESDADIVLMLCDDDALYPEYLEKLNQFYIDNPAVVYSYSHVSVFNSLSYPRLDEIETNLNHPLNEHTEPINPTNVVDASQVSWKRIPVKESGIKFPFPRTTNLDEAIYFQLVQVFGPCLFNGLISQYKGIHIDQLGVRRVLELEYE